MLRSCFLVCTVAAASPAWADDGLSWTDGKTSVTGYGLIDVGVVSRGGDSGAVETDQTRHEFQSGAGSGGSRLGLKFSHVLSDFFTEIGQAEFGYNAQGENNDGKGRANFINRGSYLGGTGPWGTLIGGKLDGARQTLLRSYDPFSGNGVAGAGQILGVTTRADDAVAYLSPSFHGFSLVVAYTADLFGTGDYETASPVYAVNLKFERGPFTASNDHEEEWWHSGGLGRLRADVFGASIDFGFARLMSFYERTKVSKPYDKSVLGFYGDHRSYSVGMVVPIGPHGQLKAAWTRRDSRSIDNRCDKFGIGYQHDFDARFSAYADYAAIDNDENGTCTIAYTTEQTSTDLGRGDAGGYGTQGVDFGMVFRF